MENIFYVFDDFYNDNLSKSEQDSIKGIKNINKTTNNKKNKTKTNKNPAKVDSGNKNDVMQNETIEDVKPFDIDTAIANAKLKQEQGDTIVIVHYTNDLTNYINAAIRQASVDGFRVCIVDVYNILDRRFGELDFDIQTEIIGKVANKFREGGYSVFMSLRWEFGKIKRRAIKISW
ncbi:MAG: hypothetical protein IJV31_00505 [Clostridia bacterium]|nr:hypothetical protein [Clostridia bacterium]